MKRTVLLAIVGLISVVLSQSTQSEIAFLMSAASAQQGAEVKIDPKTFGGYVTSAAGTRQ